MMVEPEMFRVPSKLAIPPPPQPVVAEKAAHVRVLFEIVELLTFSVLLLLALKIPPPPLFAAVFPVTTRFVMVRLPELLMAPPALTELPCVNVIPLIVVVSPAEMINI